MDKEKKKAWDFALGLVKIDDLKPSPEFLELVNRHVNGKITDGDILNWLNKKYSKGVSEND